MPVILSKEQLWFPEMSKVDESGLIAIGGGLNIERLKLAYQEKYKA